MAKGYDHDHHGHDHGHDHGEELLEFPAKKPSKLITMDSDSLVRTKALFHDANNLL